MTTRGVINSNFYQIVNVDVDGNPTDVKPEYLPNIGNVANANYANFAGNAYSVDVANVVGIGNIATINIDNNSSNILYGNGVFSALPDVGNANSANFANYANFAGDSVNANYANFAGDVVNNSQPNITSLGTLTGLNVNGVANLSDLSNIHIDGGASGYVIQTDGSGMLTWVPQSGGGGTPGGSNTQVQYNDGGSFGGTNGFIFDKSTNIFTAPYLSGEGNGLSNISGANITGEVANATYANSANIANSIAPGVQYSLLYHGPTATGDKVEGIDYVQYDPYYNILKVYGDIKIEGGLAANFIADAGHYFVGDGGYLSNISGASVTGQVSNSLVAGTVYDNSQPNITSVGTLVDLTVSGNIAVTGNVGATYFTGNGAFLTGVGNFSAAKGYFGSFYSNISQTISSTTTAYPITLNNSDPNNFGVSVTSNSHINFAYAGTYNLQYSIQFQSIDTSIHNATVWLRKNGVDVADTNSMFAVTAKHGTINGQLIGSVNYIVTPVAGDYYELIWQAESTNVSLEYIGPGTTPTSPATPSIIVTAVQVTNVQAATLSGDLTGNLIGNSYGLTGTSFIDILGNISGTQIIGNGSSLTDLTGSNVVGQVANSLIAGTVYTNSQPNITSVGTLTNLVSSGNITAQYFIGNVVGNISGNIVVPGLQWDILYNDSGNAGASSNLKFDAGNSVLTVIGNVAATYYSGNGAGLTNINGSNVSNVANANYSNFAGNAYSVSVGNVVGIGNIATINLDGNSGNILFGNGVFSAVPNVSNVANANSANFANYANFSGTSYSVSGSNVSGQVSNALIAGTVYTNAQPNITQVGTLTTLNVATSILPTSNLTYDLGNSTNRFRDLYLSGNSIYLDGQTISANSSGIAISGTLSGDGGKLSNIVGANITGTVANANYSVYSGTAYSVSGANVSGTVANATYAVDAGTAYSVSGANVSGTVANANYAAYAGNFSGTVANANFANYAGNIVNSSQPNITSVGTLSSLTVSGNINSNNSIAANIVSANSFIAATQITATTPGGTLSLTYLSPQNQSFTGSSIYNLILPDPSTLTNGAYWFVNNNSTNNIVVKNFAGTTLYTVLPGANTKFIFTGGTSWDYHSYLPNTMSASSTTANLANLVVANYFSGDGSLLTSVNGSNVSNVANANYANIAGNAYSVSGSNVSGQVSNALIAGTVYTNSQPNITSVGTLTSLSVTGNISTSNYFVGNGYYLTGISGGGGTPGGSNTYVQFNDGSTFGGNVNLTFDKATSNLTVNGNLLVNNHYPTSNTANVIFYTYPISSSTIVPAFNILGNTVTFASPAAFNNGANSNSFTVTQGQLTLGGVGTTANLIINSSNVFQGSANIVYNSTSNQLQINSPNDINVAPTGNTYLGANSKVKITGGSSGYVLSTDGAANLSWVAQSGGGSSATDFVPSFLLGGM